MLVQYMPYTLPFAPGRLIVAACQGPLLFEQRLSEVSDLDFAAVKLAAGGEKMAVRLISFLDAYTRSSFRELESTDCTGSI